MLFVKTQVCKVYENKFPFVFYYSLNISLNISFSLAVMKTKLSILSFYIYLVLIVLDKFMIVKPCYSLRKFSYFMVYHIENLFCYRFFESINFLRIIPIMNDFPRFTNRNPQLSDFLIIAF